MGKVQHLVVDSGAFIKNVLVHELAENIYTVDGAIKEIKDPETRTNLQFLPYSLKVKEPSSEAYKYVLEFSKKTGDFSSLSLVDLQIIALTYQLEKENVGTSHLNEEPSCKVTDKPCFADLKLSGFYYPKKVENETESSSFSELCASINEDNKELKNGNDETKDNNCKENDDDKKKMQPESSNSEDSDDNEEDEQSDSEEGWITSENIAEMQKMMGEIVLQDSNVSVACISTDFSIQNVLQQMGLHVLSVNGMLIKNTRVFILRCYACFKTTNNTLRQFCPNCGHKTLKRVAVKCNEDGSKTIHINFKKPINVRGTRYSLPMPRGGNHANNPVLCEDQRIPHNRPSRRALQKTDALSPDYVAFASPFAVNDVNSRSASHGIRPNKHRGQKKNPNEWSKRTGNKR